MIMMQKPINIQYQVAVESKNQISISYTYLKPSVDEIVKAIGNSKDVISEAYGKIKQQEGTILVNFRECIDKSSLETPTITQEMELPLVGDEDKKVKVVMTNFWMIRLTKKKKTQKTTKTIL